MCGYLFFLSRFIAWVGSLLTVYWVPFVYAWGCFIFNIISVSYLLRDGFNWLIPSFYLRLWLVTLLAIGPGTSEVFFNLCNLHSSLCFLAVCMLLEKPWPSKPIKFAGLTILALSSGPLFLFTPLMVLIYRITKAKRYLYLIGLTLSVMVINTIGTIRFSDARGTLSLDAFTHIPKVFIENIILRFFLAPLIGPTQTERFGSFPDLLFWGGSAAVITLFYLTFYKLQGLKRWGSYLGLALLGAYSTYAVMVVARSQSLVVISRGFHDLLWNYRYSYFAGSFTLLFYGCLIASCFASSRKFKILGVILLIALSYQTLRFYRREIHIRPVLNWAEKAAEIQPYLDQRRAGKLKVPVTIHRIPIHPEFLPSPSMTLEPI